MEVERLGWLGVRTERFDETVRFFEEVLGLRSLLREPGRAMFEVGNGDPVDVFDANHARYAHFTTGPVVGFTVADVARARRELEAAGVEGIGPVLEGLGFRWAHFVGPDGNVYELQQRLADDGGRPAS